MEESRLWGATPQEWSLLTGAGLTSDLLPVVSQHGLALSPSSKLRDMGKVPSLVTASGVVGFPGWTRHVASAAEVARWSADSRLGVCLQARRVRAIDVDVADGAVSAAVRDLVELLGGRMPCRWRANSGKLLLAFYMPGDFSKRVIRMVDGAGIIEFLAGGNQFIAGGTHPSGVRYEWDGLDVLSVLGSFPVLDAESFEGLWQGLADTYSGGVWVGRGGKGSASAGLAKPRRAADAEGDEVAEWLEAQGLVLDRGEGRLDVVCPWAAEHSDGGEGGAPSASSWFLAGVGGFAAGHYRCLHAHCAQRTDEAFKEAVGFTASQFETLPGGGGVATGRGGAGRRSGGMVGSAVVVAGAGEGVEDEDWPVLDRDTAGRIEPTASNVGKALACQGMVGHRLAWDDFGGKRVIASVGETTWREFKDSDYFRLRVELERRGFKSAPTELVREGVRFVAESKSFDSAMGWAESLVWDGTPRVERFMADVLLAEDTDYTRAVSLYLWTALAGRCMSPGCQADMVPVFVGRQGLGKTAIVAALAPTPEAFVEIDLSHRDEDALARTLRGKLVGEIAELKGLQSKDAEAIKAWVTRRVEEIRPLYAEFHVKYPRRFVAIGTSNRDDFLSDDEERRWLPVRVGVTGGDGQVGGQVDIPAFERWRDQYWAEGLALWRKGGIQWAGAQNLALAEHAAFKSRDDWEMTVAAWFAGEDEFVDVGIPRGEGEARVIGAPKRRATIQEILVGALKFKPKEITKTDSNRVGRVVRSLGLVGRKSRKDGSQVTTWGADT